ncbi:zinc-dependent metalloprotease [Skermania piniformis]|uniref:Zinc-dependent metalloprotease n=1 Tax=Skermania pinensis TaxID=39122 RepID=A0ABX8S4W0_9ACTN|nr:zinc-dependent metalloprotease [Skermania piniformis]QXQ12854.1 zinc-dependent metalloprotease [Skermania piniformis]
MTDLPFGFSSGDDDPDRAKNRPGGDSSGAQGFDPQSFDAAALGQMLTQFGQMLTNMGQTGGAGPVNYDLAKQIARQQLGASVPPVSAGAQQAVADATHLVDVWLDGATTLPAGSGPAVAWTPVDWIERTLDTWRRLCDPVAQQIAGLWTANLPAEAKDFAGPMIGMIGQMGGMAFGSQLGQALGQLAQEVLTSTDIGLPLGPTGTSALLPNTIGEFAKGLEQPEREVLVFLAAREAAHQRLFQHVPWLRRRLLDTVEEYARGIEMDLSGIERAAQGLDPTALMDPTKLEEILAQGALEPHTTPEQQAALERLETLLALIEGWVETVVTSALGERLPGVSAMSETLRRRRAGGGPAEQTFATLVGLELRPRKLREAATLWQRLTDETDIERRDGVWSHPDLLPDSADLDTPDGFVTQVGSNSELDDPIAALEQTEARERAEREAATDSATDDDRPADS